MTEPAQMKAAIEQYMTRHSAGDIDGIVELFAENASAWDPAGSEPHVGSDAIRAFFTGTHEMAERLTLTEVLNPSILPEEITGKGIVLDVRATDTQGRTIDVEVQVSSQRDYPARSAY